MTGNHTILYKQAENFKNVTKNTLKQPPIKAILITLTTYLIKFTVLESDLEILRTCKKPIHDKSNI